MIAKITSENQPLNSDDAKTFRNTQATAAGGFPKAPHPNAPNGEVYGWLPFSEAQVNALYNCDSNQIVIII